MRIPLFPLGVVMLPGMPMPLHIFEERYKLMISGCLDADTPFGIVFFDGREMRLKGCLAQVRKVVHRYDDGRMDILTLGRERFVIHELIEEKPYTEADVTLFDDTVLLPEENVTEIMSNAQTLLRQISDAAFLSESMDALANMDLRALSFAVASLSAFTREEQQHFLEMTSSALRLKKAVNALSRIVERTRLTEEIHRIIGGNGHPPKNLLMGL